MMKRFLACAAILGVLTTPATAFSVQFNWAVIMGDNNFPNYTVNSAVIGGTNGGTPGTNASGACSTVTAGDQLEIIVLVDGSGGDPGTISTPSGFTQKWQVLSGTSTRSADFIKTAAGTEGGTNCHWSVSWTSTSLNDFNWALIDHNYTGGTLPGSPLDATPTSQAFNDAGAGTVVAPSITPTATNDLLEAVYAVPKNTTFSCPSSPAMTKRIDSNTQAGIFNFSEILVCDFTLSSNSATGTLIGTYGDTTKDQVNGTIVFTQPSSGGSAAPARALLGVGK